MGSMLYSHSNSQTSNSKSFYYVYLIYEPNYMHTIFLIFRFAYFHIYLVVQTVARMIGSLKDFIPALSATKHKGEMGRLAVIGGSKEYTGAPYFSGISALHCGADLVHVICAEAAAPVIKTYSPDLIVHPDLDSNYDETKKWIDRAHAVVVGPGLGLGSNIDIATKMVAYCSGQKPLVIDADGLYIVTQSPQLVQEKRTVILTPNVVEFGRLYTAVLGCNPGSGTTEVEKLAKAMGGVTIVQKGPTDVISNGDTTVVCQEPGSPRRCGGQGDLLSGAAVTFLNWFHQAQINKGPLPFPVCVGAALAACILTRRCSHLAFSKYGRSMVTAHMIPEIQHAFQQLFG
ncbi:hypothetical protein CRM22_004482 [Opisthorchis felineus]|uniref:ATP-dependent (S)-NAD(P)H-hydrate dehydratase n=1 Tax=Opisthorchis felineus TaxID=147828 RepID=A0A4S2LWU7_OPIFE|nr:hypothetical protein CRM22_004482 [Opisthorchis felineus]